MEQREERRQDEDAHDAANARHQGFSLPVHDVVQQSILFRGVAEPQQVKRDVGHPVNLRE